MADAVRAAYLQSLPYRLLAEGFSGMNRDVEVSTPYVLECPDMFLGWVSIFVSCKVKPNDSPVAKVDCQFGGFQ